MKRERTLNEVLLCGGPRDGSVILVSPYASTVDFPNIKSNLNYAVPITSKTEKRHSWDEDRIIDHV
jgi:hypothetical protein